MIARGCSFSILIILLLMIDTLIIFDVNYIGKHDQGHDGVGAPGQIENEGTRSSKTEYWGEDTRLTFNISTSKDPDFAIDKDGNHHVVWQDDRDGNWEIYYLKLSNYGDKLINDMRITNDNFSSLNPKVIVDDTGENIHILWEDNSTGVWEIYLFALHYSAENIITVSDKIRISDNDGYSSRFGDMAFDGDSRVHFAWEDNRNGNWDIYYTLTTAEGMALISNTRLSDGRYDYTKCSLDVDPESGNTAVAYLEYRNLTHPIDPNYGLQYIKVSAFGQVISHQERFSIVSRATQPRIMMDQDGDSHIVFDDTRYNEKNNLDVFYTKLGGDGSTIIDDVYLTVGPQEGPIWHNSSEPSLVIDTNGQVHVIWMHEFLGISNIYYSLLDPGNYSDRKPIPPRDQITLIENRKISSDTLGALEPCLALDPNNNLHLVWQDRRHDNWELYYKKTNKPDITYVPSGIRFSSSSPISGEEIDIWVNVTNMRDSGKIPVNCTLYYIEKSDWDRLTLTTDLTAVTPVLEEMALNGHLIRPSHPLVPSSGHIKVAASLNTTGISGDYEVVFIIDPQKVIEETNEENNVVNASIFIRTYYFSLEAVGGTELTAKMLSGRDSVSFDLKVFNSGNSRNTINFTLSGNFTDAVVDDLSIPSLTSRTRTVLIDVPGETQWGRYNFSVDAYSVQDRNRSQEVRMSLWVSQYYDAAVVSPPRMEVIPGKEARIPLNITNTGNGDDLMELSLTGNRSWGYRFKNDNVSAEVLTPSQFLPLGLSWELDLFISVPIIAEGSAETFTVNVFSRINPGKISSASITLTVLPNNAISVTATGESELSLEEGEQDFYIRVENTGNIPCNYTVLLPEVEEGLTIAIDIKNFDLGVGYSVDIVVNISFDETVFAGTYHFQIDVVSTNVSYPLTRSVTLTMMIPEVIDFSFESSMKLKVTPSPGEVSTFRFNLFNTGNVNNTISLSIPEEEQKTWWYLTDLSGKTYNHTSEDISFDVAPGKRMGVIIEILPNATAEPGEYNFTIIAKDSAGQTMEKEIVVTIREAEIPGEPTSWLWLYILIGILILVGAAGGLYLRWRAVGEEEEE